MEDARLLHGSARKMCKDLKAVLEQTGLIIHAGSRSLSGFLLGDLV